MSVVSLIVLSSNDVGNDEMRSQFLERVSLHVVVKTVSYYSICDIGDDVT